MVWLGFMAYQALYYGGARGGVVIVVGNGHGDTRLIAFHIALIPLGKV